MKKDEQPKGHERVNELAKAAVDKYAPWVKEHNKEVAGTINSKGEILEGPVKSRSLRSSDPGKITSDTVAIWHIHLLLSPNPYHLFLIPHLAAIPFL